MAFDLTVSFSGIIAFTEHPSGVGIRLLIPNSLFGHYDSSDNFIPDHTAERNAMDGRPLHRHYPRLTRDNLFGPRLRLLRDEELVFVFHPQTPCDLEMDMRNIVSMSDVWGRGDIDRNAHNAPNLSSLVTSHIDISCGQIRATDVAKWLVPGYCRNKGGGDADLHACFTTNVDWVLKDLTQVTVSTKPYRNEPSQSWTFTSPTRLLVANHCTDPSETQPEPRERLPDDDFRWHYELMSSSAKTSLRGKLRPQGLPIPYPDKYGICERPPIAEGIITEAPPFGNCMPAAWF